MRQGTIPWYAKEILTALGDIPHFDVAECELLHRLAGIMTRWLTKEVPHGTTKRRLKKLHRDAIALDAQRAGEA